MIKSVRIEPVQIEGNRNLSYAKVFVEIDAYELAMLYLKKEINPATIAVPYVTVNGDIEYINLRTAALTGHEVSVYIALDFGQTQVG